jgi:oxygen-dependent protoporphyrinogen oxidase
MHSNKSKIAVIGGGISGLATAHQLMQLDCDVTLFEARKTAGGPFEAGYMGTTLEYGFVVEHGPNGFLNNEPETLKLTEELGLTDRIVWSGQKSKDRFIYWDGQLHKVPMGPPQLMESKLLSPFGKLRLLAELAGFGGVGPEGESVFEFAERRFGVEVAERLVSPMVVGVFAGDAKRLSLEHAFPRMRQAEQDAASLILAAIKKKVGSKLFSFKNGTGELVQALQEKVGPRAWWGQAVTGIQKVPREDGNTWRVQTNAGEFDFEHVVITTDHQTSAKWAEHLGRTELSALLNEMPCQPVISVSIAFAARIPFAGFGTLIAREGGSFAGKPPGILGFLHPSDIFEGRSPEAKSLVTVMMGGVLAPEVAHTNTESWLQSALSDLTKILGPLPAVEKCWSWCHRPGIPQYDVRVMPALSLQMTEELRHSPSTGLWWNGNWHGGVAMNDCIRKSRQLALNIAGC